MLDGQDPNTDITIFQNENDAMLKEVESLVFSGECVLFVGAGITIPEGKTWPVSVSQIAEGCEVTFDKQKSSTTNENVSDYLEDVIDKCMEKNLTKCNEICRKLFPKHASTVRTSLINVLALPFHSILTTNFDPWIRKFSANEKHRNSYKYPALPLINGFQNGLYYLHGLFDSEDKFSCISQLVFGQKSFKDAYHKSLLAGFLLNVFVYRTVLFIGFNPTEKNMVELLKNSIKIRNSIQKENLPKRYILWPTRDPDIQYLTDEEEEEKKELINTYQMTLSTLRDLEIIPVYYDPIDRKYSGLDILTDSWVEKTRPSPDGFKTGFER